MSDKRKECTKEETVVTDVGEIKKEMLDLMTQTHYIRSLLSYLKCTVCFKECSKNYL